MNRGFVHKRPSTLITFTFTAGQNVSAFPRVGYQSPGVGPGGDNGEGWGSSDNISIFSNDPDCYVSEFLLLDFGAFDRFLELTLTRLTPPGPTSVFTSITFTDTNGIEQTLLVADAEVTDDYTSDFLEDGIFYSDFYLWELAYIPSTVYFVVGETYTVTFT